MAGTMRHRGPDDEGFLDEGNLSLGMRRLSIIDLAGGHQPIFNEDGSVGVVLNGEIYNFQAIQTELKRLGHSSALAQTGSHRPRYEERGAECGSLAGMFAFAVWDAETRSLYRS